MSHDHKHSGHDHHGHAHGPSKPIHNGWWFFAAVVLMLGAMLVYVMSDDEAIGPGGVGEQVPAAAAP